VENHERLRIGCHIPPQRIRAGDVTVKRCRGTRGLGNEKGNMVGIPATGCGSNKRSERIAPDEMAQAFPIVFCKSLWQVHGSTWLHLQPTTASFGRSRLRDVSHRLRSVADFAAVMELEMELARETFKTSRT